jgi:putative endonuclease
MRDHEYFVYMLANKPQGTLYVGVTNDLMRRVYEHREGLLPGFTKKYGVKMLVWYNAYGDINDAIAWEKRIKRWRRDWKKNLIECDNPHWIDLYPNLLNAGSRTAPSARPG